MFDGCLHARNLKFTNMKVSKRRIFIKNLPETASQAEIEKAFADYGKVESIEIKERKTAVEGQSLFFAYVNLEADDTNLQQCFQDFAAELWHGQYVQLQVAKESFLERLKRERQETGGKVNGPLTSQSSTAPVVSKVKENGVDEKKKVEESSSDSGTDSSSDEDVKPETSISKINNNKKPKSSSSSSSSSEEEDEKTNIPEVSDLVIKNNRHKTFSSGLKIESAGKAPIATIEIHPKRKKVADLSNADTKRLKSMQDMIDRYKQQKSLLKTGLSRVDFKPKNKIIFDENQVQPTQTDNENKKKSSKESKNRLFDDEEESPYEGEDFNFEIKEQFQGKKGQKLLELQSKYKNDKRFNLDERFIDEEIEQENSVMGNNEEITLEEEKKKEYEILEQVLGGKIKRPIDSEKNVIKGMLRFDPLQPDHSKYELTAPQKESNKTKKKRKEADDGEKKEDSEQPLVSKEVFYKVREDLKETLQETQGFSLLSMFGSAEERNDDKNEDSAITIEKKVNKFGKERNPFKYDSSEDEEEVEETKIKPINKKQNQTSSVKFQSEPFFFRDDDYRLQEGFDFIQRMAGKEKSDFVQVRRQLKQIVKAKVKNNQRKNKMFKKKLGGSKRKKMVRMKKAMKR